MDSREFRVRFHFRKIYRLFIGGPLNGIEMPVEDASTFSCFSHTNDGDIQQTIYTLKDGIFFHTED